MELSTILIISIISAMDGFFVGLTIGWRGTKMKLVQLVLLSIWNIPFAIIALLTAGIIDTIFPTQFTNIAGGILIIAVGLFSFFDTIKRKEDDFEKNHKVSNKELIIMGIALASDGFASAFSIGLWNGNILLVPSLFMVSQFILLCIGNKVGLLKSTKNITKKAQLLPSVILMLIGVIRLLPI